MYAATDYSVECDQTISRTNDFQHKIYKLNTYIINEERCEDILDYILSLSSHGHR